MESVNFKESNTNLIGDHLVDQYGRQVENIWAYQDGKEVITRWRMSWRERASALLFGTVWLHVLGVQPPPVALNVEKAGFLKG